MFFYLCQIKIPLSCRNFPAARLSVCLSVHPSIADYISTFIGVKLIRSWACSASAQTIKLNVQGPFASIRRALINKDTY